MKDPLDQEIDALLASRPIKPSDDFAARVLAAAEAAEAEDAARSAKRPLGTLIKLALPLAAAVVLTISLLQFNTGSTPAVDATAATAATAADATALSNAEAQEIFLLEESLDSLATLSTTEFGTQDLLSTLDALYLDI